MRLRLFIDPKRKIMRAISTLLAGTLLVGVAAADEVRVDVVFADDFDAAPATVFRIGSIALRDPHVFYFFLICVDGTDELNGEVQQQLDADQDGDGFYDASALVVMRPYANDNRPHRFENQDGVCTTTLPSQCSPGVEPPSERWYQSFDAAPPTVCLGALPNTTSGYMPPVPAPDGNCFATTVTDTSLPFGTLSIPLWDTALAAPWPSTNGSTGGGLLRGFLRESDADQLPIDLGGETVPLSSLLPDGTGSCATGVANGKDVDRDEPGWWMYLEYRLDAVSETGF
jgi:hypothetical protein